MGVLWVLLLSAIAAAAYLLAKESGAAIRHGDETAKERYGGKEHGKDQKG